MHDALIKLVSGRHLDEAEMERAMRVIMQGDATPAQIGGFLVALRMKGETVVEIAAAARVMREFAKRVHVVHPNLVDIVGTGGDGSHTFNISTTAAFVVAGAGGRVAKHNNRSVSSRTGSADVLEAAGVRINLTPEQVARCINEVGIGFMFAPAHHGAARHAAAPRRELGVGTLFNLLGPLTNPASVPNQLIGVFSDEYVEPLAQVMQRLGSRHVMVVHSADGLDEISLAAPTHVAELKDGRVHMTEITPEQFGFTRSGLDGLRVRDAAESLKVMRAVLEGTPGPATDTVLLNAGAAIYAAGLAPDHAAGIDRARESISGRAACGKLDQLVSLTRTFSPEAAR
ncbi:MAG: anthranilate phosphoribosyltransferase [Gammaproteobacteria bacterium]|nr:anthranilate phosphoribosyltransferase [Gammaproteobacteria bacterium]